MLHSLHLLLSLFLLNSLNAKIYLDEKYYCKKVFFIGEGSEIKNHQGMTTLDPRECEVSAIGCYSKDQKVKNTNSAMPTNFIGNSTDHYVGNWQFIPYSLDEYNRYNSTNNTTKNPSLTQENYDCLTKYTSQFEKHRSNNPDWPTDEYNKENYGYHLFTILYSIGYLNLVNEEWNIILKKIQSDLETAKCKEVTLDFNCNWNELNSSSSQMEWKERVDFANYGVNLELLDKKCNLKAKFKPSSTNVAKLQVESLANNKLIPLSYLPPANCGTALRYTLKPTTLKSDKKKNVKSKSSKSAPISRK